MTLNDQLEELFREVFGDDDIVLTDETTAHDIAGWDSVAHINLMCSIEQRFGVQFTGNELAELQNIGALKQLLADKGRR